ncbi:MAG: hypothetical protein ACFE7R_08685 [Candidatus Hodarchaeota archaeon]
MHIGKIALLLCSFLVMSTAIISTASNQDLEWGIEVGDTFDYTFAVDSTVDGVSSIPSEDFTLEVLSLETIPDDIDSFSDFSGFAPTFEGSVIGDTSLLGIYSMYLEWAFPIGNWALLSDVYDDIFNPSHIVDRVDTWGLQLSPNDVDYYYDINVKWSKTDGMLNFFDMRFEENNGDGIISYRITRAGLVVGGLEPVILTVAAIAVVGVFALVIFLKKR